MTSHNPIAGAPLFSEVVTGEEGRAMTLDSGPSEALGRQSCRSSSFGAESPAGRSRDRSGRCSGEEPGYGKVVPYIVLAPAKGYGPLPRDQQRWPV